MVPNSFVIKINGTRDINGKLEYKTDNLTLETLNVCDNHIQLKKCSDGFSIFFGEATKHPFDDSNIPSGTLIEYGASKNQLLIKSDRLGTCTAYWRKSGSSLTISNRLENLALGVTQPDWSSIQQYLHTGFTVGSNTFYENVLQTTPNLNVSVCTISSRMETSNRSVPETSQYKSHNEILEEISDQLEICLKNAHRSVLMMSAGWDSRTLLVGPKPNISACYSHGDLNSREISIARSISGNQRHNHIFVDVKNCRFDTDLIERMLLEVGFCVFPIWYLASQNIQRWDGNPIMSGVLGELLGGHYGLMAWGSRLQKIAASLSLVNNSLISENQINHSIDRYCEPPKTHWFVSEEGQEILDVNRTKTKSRVLEAIKQQRSTSGSWLRAIEDFNMSHRARQYILKQAQSASSTVGYTIPFADEQLTDLIRQLDFEHRVHNKANRYILRKRNPILLAQPMAATLIPASYPILAQELTRVIRVAGEQFSRILGKQPPRLGWFNYQHLYDNDTLHNLTDSIDSSIWDKKKMHQSIRSNPKNQVDAGSTLDMICKIKTVDHYLLYLKNQ